MLKYELNCHKVCLYFSSESNINRKVQSIKHFACLGYIFYNVDSQKCIFGHFNYSRQILQS